MSLPNDVLRFIANEILAKQNAVLPLRDVCRRFRQIVQDSLQKTKINDAVENSIRIGSLSLLEWYYNKVCRFSLVPGLCNIAARNGHLTILQWLRQGDEKQVPPRPICPWDERTCHAAASGGHLAVLQWVRQNGCQWDERTCSSAAREGHLAVLQWARQNGCPWDNSTWLGAARRGQLAVLQWAQDNGCPSNTNTCTNAAAAGHLDVLQWARQNGCPWDVWTCESAARQGHLAVLQWALENKCPWDRESWFYAQKQVRDWLEKNGYL